MSQRYINDVKVKLNIQSLTLSKLKKCLQHSK